MMRPNLHITSPNGWLNDPCAPCYHPRTDLYHLFYQCNPTGVEWGNMSWGHATSKDLLTWNFAQLFAPLKPDRSYDKDGVFTGCMTPPTGDHELEVFYSSICALPFHWTDPAARGTAGLSMATSTDGGLTWTKSENNPILPEEPKDLKVTGFRDPYLAKWPSMDRVRGEESLYGLISGGIQKTGPTTFLYAVDSRDRSKWEYLGPLVDMPERFQPCSKWECNYGINWECVNFMTLTSSSTNTTREFLVLGSEGDIDRDHVKSHNLPDYIPPRTTRHQQWMCGDLVKAPSGQVRFKHNYGGILDHGIYYAANSFHDPKTDRRIVYGWIPEEDCSPEYCKRNGWNGALAFPREIFVQTITNVVGSLRSPLNSISSIEIESTSSERRPNPTFNDNNMNNTKSNPVTIHTLGIKPISELFTLQTSSLLTHTFGPIPLSKTSQSHILPISTTSPTWSLATTISIPITSSSKCKSLGLHIRQTPDASTRTTIVFDLSEEKITVDRSKSLPSSSSPSLAPSSTSISTSNSISTSSEIKSKSGFEFNLCPDSGPFTLFRTRRLRTDEQQQEEELEKLNMYILSDGNILELFVNDRFALATMVYTDPHNLSVGDGDGERVGGGLELFAIVETVTEEAEKVIGDDKDTDSDENGDGVLCVFEQVVVWDGLNQGKSLIGEDKDWAAVASQPAVNL